MYMIILCVLSSPVPSGVCWCAHLCACVRGHVCEITFYTFPVRFVLKILMSIFIIYIFYSNFGRRKYFVYLC